MIFDKLGKFLRSTRDRLGVLLNRFWDGLKAFFREDESTLKRDAIIATVMFSLLLPWMLLFKFNKVYLMRRGYLSFLALSLKERFMLDLIPFRFTEDYVNQILVIILNCAIFAPFGVAFNTLFKKKSIKRDLLICFLISLGVELTQLFTLLGGFATIDLITNTISYFIGYLIYKLVFARLSLKWHVRIYRLSILLLIPLVSVAAVTTLGNLDVIWGILTRTLR